MSGEGCLTLGNPKSGYLLYTLSDKASIAVEQGTYEIYSVDARNGDINPINRATALSGRYSTEAVSHQILWIKRK
jgi:hypothetical protein